MKASEVQDGDSCRLPCGCIACKQATRGSSATPIIDWLIQRICQSRPGRCEFSGQERSKKAGAWTFDMPVVVDELAMALRKKFH